MILEFPKKIKNKIIFLNNNKKILIKIKKPFNDECIEFFDELSNIILKDKNFKKYPDLIYFGFWIRKSKITKLKYSYNLNNLFGRGLVFHVTPSNTPLNFLYSFAFGVLSGNSNIVKIPMKEFAEIKIFFKLLKKLKRKSSKKILLNNLFLRYKNYDEINNFFSKNCNARLIWGGDNTINLFKKYNTKPRCLDLNFSDRYSFSIVNCEKLKNLNNNSFNQLIRNFYNDTYLYDQMACSSPNLIIWVNYKKVQVENFWKKLLDLAKQKYNLNNTIYIEKFTKFQIDKIKLKNTNFFYNYKNILVRVGIKNFNKNFENLKGSYGYFYEIKTNKLNNIIKNCSSKIQTITYFGFDKKYIENNILRKVPEGIDRVVPFGKSTDINLYWDGYDIIRLLSRKLEILNEIK